MNITTLSVGEFEANCHIVWGEHNEAIVIDPGSDTDTILEFLRDNGLSTASYMLTHGHVDHLAATAALYKTNPAPIGIHQADLDWAFGMDNHFEPFYSPPEHPGKIDRILEDGQIFTDGHLEYRIMGTPGHSPGSVCFYFHKENTLFSGDTLFAGSIGRTDLPGGNMREMNRSLQKLATLPDETIIYSGHGPSSSIGFERKSNFYMMKQETIHE